MANMTFFFGAENPLSNWHPAKFIVKGVVFVNVEQYMMYCKAKFFGDEATSIKILAANSPRQHKALGRQAQGFVESIWIEKRTDFVRRGCLEKFRQNPEMGEVLLATENSQLVEASPYDKIWGAGLAANDPRILDVSKWPGLNLLGGVLEDVRDNLAQDLVDRQRQFQSPR